ncbi:LPS export ABC transporter periplasmic protein LptC [Undibacterium sp. CY18W]|uniref:LPS export ABC transporter periplasmic protein LptC n=1 Tax=Undibacterium hunanense TaxID=2762292 RepID=A0ABR6ZYH0_9BURK|nr:LPS export ABC transporter periplasmic protein LptC [Undibacterium hunanense]MBC3920678.1 LPS export ABC transporter periplasmic protein LptC [Undibacterium hunanense]
MKHHMTIDRFRIWLAVILLGVMTLGTIWVMEVIRRNANDEQNRSSARSAPDYYVEKFNFIRLSNNGKANYHITGERLIHLPRNDNIEIQRPQINSFDVDRPPLHLLADLAVVSQKSTMTTPKREHDEVRLYDNVSMERPEGLSSQFMRLETNYLLLLPDEDIVKTDKPITVKTGKVDTTAVGMVANNSTQHLALLSKVRIHLKKREREPAPSTPSK